MRRSRCVPVRAIALLGLVALSVLVFLEAAGVRAEGFEPVPCRDEDWVARDPAFEALPGAEPYFGSYEGGVYQFEVPEQWNGELVLYAHGYRGEGNEIYVSAPPFLRQYLIDEGYAWAASSYACNGYVPGIGLRDTVALIDLFPQVTGREPPERVYLVGVSMGGHITILGMHAYPERFDAGLALCPAGPTLFDYFLAMAAAAEAVTGIRFSAEEPATDTVARMMAILGTPPDGYTERGLQLASVMIESSGGARPFAFDGLHPYFAQTIAIGGGRLAGDESLIARSATNASWEYRIDESYGLTLGELLASVRRVEADPAIRGEAGPYLELKPFSGDIARPLMTVHTTGDMFVPIFLQRDLRAAVESAGNGDLLVQRIVRDSRHCGFSEAEVKRAFEDLVAWSKGGPRPEGDDVFADLIDAGRRFTDPVREGDPGTVRPVAGAPPAPPATGTGLAPSEGRDLPGWLPAALLFGLLLGLGGLSGWKARR